jgi:hypothetical protein
MKSFLQFLAIVVVLFGGLGLVATVIPHQPPPDPALVTIQHDGVFWAGGQPLAIPKGYVVRVLSGSTAGPSYSNVRVEQTASCNAT